MNITITDTLSDSSSAATEPTIESSPEGPSVRRENEVTNEMVYQYMNLVDHVVNTRIDQSRFYRFTLDDIRSSAMIGLYKALCRGDISSIIFEGYARTRIYGQIIDDYRRHHPCGRQVLKKKGQFKKACQVLEARLSRVPTDDEIRQELSVPESEWKQWKLHSIGVLMESIDETFVGDKGEIKPRIVLVDGSPTPVESIQTKGRWERVLAEIDKLPDRQKEVVIRHCFHYEEHEQIARSKGCTGSNIGQIYQRAIAVLRSKLSDVDSQQLVTQ